MPSDDTIEDSLADASCWYSFLGQEFSGPSVYFVGSPRMEGFKGIAAMSEKGGPEASRPGRKLSLADSHRQGTRSTFGASQTGIFLGELLLSRARFRFTRHPQDNEEVTFGHRSHALENLSECYSIGTTLPTINPDGLSFLGGGSEVARYASGE